MNAHADMFIIVGYNDLNTPRSIYRSLVSGVRKFPVFKSPKQALINAFYNMSSCFTSVSDGISFIIQLKFFHCTFYNFFQLVCSHAKRFANVL